MSDAKDLDSQEVNPYEKYRYVAFSLDEFLKMVNENKEHFICYCEIVITDNGIIFLASPSHDIVLERLEKKGFSNCISVWYIDWGFGECDVKDFKRLTASQRRVLKSLISHGLIVGFISDDD